MKSWFYTWLCFAIGIYIGIWLDQISIKHQGEPNDTPCKAQVVEWAKTGKREFTPTRVVRQGFLLDGVCITQDIGAPNGL